MIKITRHLLFCLVLIFTGQVISSQDIPHPVVNTGIYEFLDELANGKLIELNSAIKPYSRLFIAGKLEEVAAMREKLSHRQQKELDVYLADFGKELGDGKDEGGAKWLSREMRKRRFDMFYYRDSLFSITVNPIFGGEIFRNSSGTASYWRNGLNVVSSVKNWGFFVSMRDNHETPLLGNPVYLTARTDGHMKENNSWEEISGGVTWSWKWGNAGIVKDNVQWGNNYNGANIFGGRNPSFVQFRLNIRPVKWFDFNYFHGWLNSLVVDSTRSYWVTNSYGSDYREVYHKKFIAANMFTFTPLKNLNISAGNSIVYSDLGVFPAYLMPLFFYKAVDHSVNSGIDNMNSQMFFDISSRQVKNLHLYATLFVDELSVRRFTLDDEWNFFSWKAGFRLSNFPVSDLSFTTEFTYSYPLAFQHYVPTLTFESNSYNLGHYLRDNSREWYFSIDYRPWRTLKIKLFVTDAIRGPDYTELGTDRVGNPPLSSVEWHNTSAGLKASFQVINDLYVWAAFTSGNITGDTRWSPLFYYGRRNTINSGITFGF